MTSTLDPLPRRVNLGCGFDRRDGYLNVDFQDFHDPDLVADVRDLSALPDSYFDEVMAIDVLEHLPRGDTEIALREWHRILAPGGTLRLQTPDITAIGELLHERDDHASHVMFLHHMYGTQAYNGDFHLAGFTDRVMIATLRSIGFDSIRVECEHRWLLVATATKPIGDPDPIAIAFSKGCFGRELDAAGHPFRWCESSASVLVANVSNEILVADVRIELAGHWDATPVPVRIEGLGPPRTLELGSQPTSVDAAVALGQDGLRIRLRCDGPAVQVADDVRDLRFRLGDVDYTIRPTPGR